MHGLTRSGIQVRPFWRILPEGARVELGAGEIPLFLGPGAGWGTGAHETTQLCLQAIGVLRPRRESWRMVDFGSGSGLLSIAGAKLGAKVGAVEIDESGIEHGILNSRINGVEASIESRRSLVEVQVKAELVIANILRPVLIANAEPLCARLSPSGILVLSGLVATDVPEVSVRYSRHLSGRLPQVYERGEWRALVWAPTS